eukprot:scaffold171097_cov69-Attheya_sp.AAC.2
MMSPKHFHTSTLPHNNTIPTRSSWALRPPPWHSPTHLLNHAHPGHLWKRYHCSLIPPGTSSTMILAKGDPIH